MELADLEKVKLEENLPIDIHSLDEVGNCVSINNFVALKIVKINNSFNRENVIEIKLEGVLKGFVIFTKHLPEKDLNSMSEFEFIALLNEMPTHRDFLSRDLYKFEYDYLILNQDFHLEYLESYKMTAPLWGGFSHGIEDSEPEIRFTDNILEIELGEKLANLDSFSYESAIRAIEQPYAFERFLKLYHLLELQFDYFLIKQIKDLEIPRDSSSIGNLLNSYSRQEVDRLSALIKHNCSNIGNLETKLAKVLTHQSIAEDIFYNFASKGSNNPLKEKNRFDQIFTLTSFTLTNLKTARITNTQNHDNFIQNLTAFWIYRIRCSIAHNKIGEYILSWTDEDFIVQFGEPLLKEVLLQSFKK